MDKTWTGVLSNDWADDDNWDPAGVPMSTDDVTIGAGGAPVISSDVGTVASVTIETGGTVIFGFPTFDGVTYRGDIDLADPVNGAGIFVTGAGLRVETAARPGVSISATSASSSSTAIRCSTM